MVGTFGESIKDPPDLPLREEICLPKYGIETIIKYEKDP